MSSNHGLYGTETPQPIFMKLEIYNYLPHAKFQGPCRREWSWQILKLARTNTSVNRRRQNAQSLRRLLQQHVRGCFVGSLLLPGQQHIRRCPWRHPYWSTQHQRTRVSQMADNVLNTSVDHARGPAKFRHAEQTPRIFQTNFRHLVIGNKPNIFTQTQIVTAILQQSSQIVTLVTAKKIP